MTNRPLKRHPALHDLSRHHHHGLVIAQRAIRLRGEDGAEAVWDFVADLKKFWHGGGEEHFAEEENILLGAYARYGDMTRPEIVQMLDEHERIRDLVVHIESSAIPSRADITKLGEWLERHIRLEERVVFPIIQETIPPDVLESLCNVFSDLTPKVCKSFVRHPQRPSRTDASVKTILQGDSSTENS